ncbi:MAG: rRNA maturation RNase YbeY [Firmicutes bacterium]|nr:rRNA maturation RNase YbeY [Bacillota bacterium]
MTVIINNRQRQVKIEKELEEALVRLAERVLSAHGKDRAEAGVTLVGEKKIQQLNRDYRGIDAPTDVLSFPMQEPGEIQTGEEPEILGDVVICVPRAAAQARDFGHSFRRELFYLAVHGLLHLLGFDHENETEKRKMREKEEAFLSGVNGDEE